MFCDSLTQHPMHCLPRAFGPQPMPAPAHAPYEGVIITGIVCLTIIILALIMRCLVIKLKQPVVQNESDEVKMARIASEEKERLLKRKYILDDKKLAFREDLAKNGSGHPKEAEEYLKLIDELQGNKKSDA